MGRIDKLIAELLEFYRKDIPEQALIQALIHQDKAQAIRIYLNLILSVTISPNVLLYNSSTEETQKLSNLIEVLAKDNPTKEEINIIFEGLTVFITEMLERQRKKEVYSYGCKSN